MLATLPTLRRAAPALAAMTALGVQAQTVPDPNALAAKEQPALMKTLQQLVEIESGEPDRQGLDRIAGVIAQRLRELGGQVQSDRSGHDHRLADLGRGRRSGQGRADRAGVVQGR